MQRKVANFISLITHPVILPILAVFLVAYKESGNLIYAVNWTTLVVFLSAIATAFILFGMKKGFISNFDISVRKQRVIIYPFVTALVLIFVAFIYILKGPRLMEYASVALVISLIILDFVNTKIKASIHMASITALAIGLVALYGGLYYLLFFLIPLVAWSRVTLHRHTPKETLVGAGCGMILTLITIYIVQLLGYGY